MFFNTKISIIVFVLDFMSFFVFGFYFILLNIQNKTKIIKG